MSDGKITNFLNGFLAPQGEHAAKPVPIRIVELPPALLGKTTISGEVVSAKNGKVEIRTPQGVVTVEADLPVEVGQKISLKLLVTTERASAQNLAALFEVIDDQKPVPVKPQEEVAAPTRSLTRAPIELSTRVSDTPVTLQNVPVAARFVTLPEVLSKESLQQLVKTILQLNPLVNLPQTLTEGLEKIQQLYPLIRSDMPLPLTRMERTLSPVLLNLIQLFQSVDKLPEATNFMMKQPAQQGFILEMLPPGQILDSESIRPLHKQITELLQFIQAQTKPAAEAAPAQLGTPFTSFLNKEKLQEFLTKPPKEMMDIMARQAQNVTGAMTEKAAALVEKIPQMIPMGKSEPLTLQSFIQKSETLLTPALALVLGQKAAPDIFEGKTPTLLLLQNPRGEQSLSLMTLDVLGEKISIPKTVLPGSVLLMAIPQKIAATATALPNIQAIWNETQMPALNPSFGNSWPALEELFNEIMFNHAAPPESAALMRQTLPSPVAQQMTSSALFFLSVLRQGDVGTWLGAALQAKGIADEKIALIKQLTRDLHSIRSGLTDPMPADTWRPLPMPLQLGDHVVRMQWFFRHQDEELSEEEGHAPLGRKTRFLLDVPKTRLGDIQIDGLVQVKRLDLILRTESGMPSYMEEAIRGRYHSALELSGFSGAMAFQAGRHHYVRVN